MINSNFKETRQRILDAAGKQFLTQGYETTRLEDIVREARVSKTAIYKIFGGKRDLFLALNDVMVNKALQIISQTGNMDATSITTVQRSLERIGTNYLTNITTKDCLALFRLNLSIAARFKDAALNYYLTGPEQLNKKLTIFFTDINQAGVLNIPNSEIAAEQFSSMIRGTIYQRALLDINYEFTPEYLQEYVEQSVKLFINGHKA